MTATSRVIIPTPDGEVPAHLAAPAGAGPWPGVVVIDDALGLSRDARDQAGWLAGAGYLAVVPDLYHGRRSLTCFIRLLRAPARPLAEVDAARAWLTGRDDCTGRVGVIGYCMGGGFALMLAPGHDFAAASVNYGPLPKNAERALAGACPIVGSFGGKDFPLRGAAAKLSSALAANDVPHDVKEYPDAGHSFLNDHDRADLPVPLRPMMNRLPAMRYHEASAIDARQRIVAFFDGHLK